MATKVYLIPEIGFVQVPDGGTREYLIPEGGFFSEGAGSPDVSVSATTAELTLTTYSSVVTVDLSVVVQATKASLTLTKHNAAVSYSVNIAASCSSLTITKYDATVGYETVNCFDTDPACKALWRFESGALTTDSIGTNTLTNSGVAENTTYVYEGACAADFEFSDETDALTITDANLDTGFPLKSGESNRVFSLCFWMRPESIFAVHVYDKGATSDNTMSFAVATPYYASNYVELTIWNGCSDGTDVETWGVCNFPVGQAYHVSVMHDGDSKETTVRFYNATADVAFTRTHTWSYQTSITSAALAIGNKSVPAAGNGFDGVLDEMVVFDRLLTVGEADAIRGGSFKYTTGDIFAACAGLALTEYNATVLHNIPVNVTASIATLTLHTYSATLSDADNVNVRADCSPLTLTSYQASVIADIIVLADCAVLTLNPKYAVVSVESHAVIETGWAKDRNLGPWAFNKPPKKYGYQNNPRWVAKDRATTIHKPCGYWPLVYSEIGWYQQVVTIDKDRKIVGASMISQDNAQYKLLYLNYETDSIIKQVDFSSSSTIVHTYYGATMMFDNVDGVPRILYLNYEDTNLRSYAYDYTGRMTDVTIDNSVSIDYRTQGAYLGSGVVVCVNYKNDSTYCYRSTNYGNAWSDPILVVADVGYFASGGGRLYVAYGVVEDDQPIRMRYSDNQGVTWYDLDTLPDSPEHWGTVYAFSADGDNVVLVYDVEGTLYFIYSTNKGLTWGACTLPVFSGEAGIYVMSVHLSGDTGMLSCYGLTTGDYYTLRSIDAGANWTIVTKHPTYITDYNVPTVEKSTPLVLNHDDDAMVATFCGYAIHPGDLAFQLSLDDGESWMQRTLHVGASSVNYGPNPVWTMPK